jgi:monofunctional biosynthetic peptidoglycan transglycosylase
MTIEEGQEPRQAAGAAPDATGGATGGATAGGSAAGAARRRTILRRVAKAAAVIVAIPIVLVPVYLVVPPISTLMVWQTVTLTPVKRTFVPIEDIAPNLVRAVIMSEDGRFCEHGGVDWDALFEVIDNEDGPSRGASTIPMQTVKNLFLWPGRSYLRKALEIPLAVYADLVWPKRRMMEIYLNIAEWGPGIFGAEAAARHYFDKPAAKLTRREASLLAAALPNPFVRNPAEPGRGMRRIAGIIERRVQQSGAYVTCVLGDP